MATTSATSPRLKRTVKLKHSPGVSDLHGWGYILFGGTIKSRRGRAGKKRFPSREPGRADIRPREPSMVTWLSRAVSGPRGWHRRELGRRQRLAFPHAAVPVTQANRVGAGRAFAMPPNSHK